MDELLHSLEYTLVLRIIRGFTLSPLGSATIAALHPSGGVEEARERLNLVEEMRELVGNAGRPPVGGARDLKGVLAPLATEGFRLDTDQLLQVLTSCEATAACRQHLIDRAAAPALGELAGALQPQSGLTRRLRETFDERGGILDGASFVLRSIRSELRATRQSVRDRLERMLGDEHLTPAFQDRLITERNGRYVLPVKADYRGRIKGFIHDQSASGQTLYIEPATILDGNNQIQLLLRRESAEIEKILRQLSALVRERCQPILANQEILARIDSLQAIAQFASRTGARPPQIADSPIIDLRAIRHPLLILREDGSPAGVEVVPSHVRLGDDTSILVISGPNTGGKTVLLKNIGLAVLLVRSGIPLCADPRSTIFPFRQIFLDIGDHQNIAEALSTYSAHLVRMRAMLKGADAESLVLLDEAGTGTDPAEGGALIVAILDHLRKVGSRAVVTTHLSRVKGYASATEGVQNAAVEFNAATLRPTYRLHYGFPGESNALNIARHLGFPAEILAVAEGLLDPHERRGAELVAELNELKREAAEDRLLAEVARREAEIDRQRVSRILEDIRARRRAIKEKAVARGERMVREIDAQVRRISRTLKSGEAEEAKTEVKRLRREVQEARPQMEPVGPRPTEVVAGEILRVALLGVDGEVQQVRGNSVDLLVGGKRMSLKLNALQQYQPRRFAAGSQLPRVAAAPSAASDAEEGFLPTLEIAGCRVEDGLERLDKFLDQALQAHAQQVEIVHGVGTGVLRQAVRTFLQEHRGIAGFRVGTKEEGGGRLTVAFLKG